jgi:uncharacterized protein YggT (Ycf19 family)
VNLLIPVFNVLRLVILADAVFSWVLKPDQFPRSLTKPLLDPVYDPLRSALKPIMHSVDVSPLIALAVLYVLQLLVERSLVRKD